MYKCDDLGNRCTMYDVRAQPGTLIQMMFDFHFDLRSRQLQIGRQHLNLLFHIQNANECVAYLGICHFVTYK